MAQSGPGHTATDQGSLCGTEVLVDLDVVIDPDAAFAGICVLRRRRCDDGVRQLVEWASDCLQGREGDLGTRRKTL
jgi:hypothetical protein